MPWPERQIDDPVPAQAMLRNVDIALVVQEPVAVAQIVGKAAGGEYVALSQEVAAPSITARTQGVAHHVVHLEAEASRIAALQFELDSMEVRPSGFVVLFDRPIRDIVTPPPPDAR